MPIDGMSKIHMHAPSSRPRLGGDSGGTVVKVATFGAIVAIFGGAFYFMSGRSSQNPVGAPATVSPAPAAAIADANAATNGAAAQASAPQATAAGDAAPAQASAAPAQPAAAPADKQLAQSAPPAQPAAASAQPAAPSAPAEPAAAAVVDSSAPAQDEAPAHHASHKKLHLASARSTGQAAAPGSAPLKAEPDAVSILNPWWQGAEAQPFKITAVSPVKGQPALAVVFSEPVDASAGDHLKLLNNDGSTAAGSWAPGANPHVLVRNGVSPGRYMLFVDGTVASTGGKSLGSDMSGPVYVMASR